MCSLSWRAFADGLTLVFTRDESVTRPKAELPKVHLENGVRFLMPRDPKGGGSWVAANEHGLIIALLNDYQGQMKPVNEHLLSRGLLVRRLATCRSYQEVINELSDWPLYASQPFQLAVFIGTKNYFWHYDGHAQKIEPQVLPFHLFSSGHSEAADIINARQTWVDGLNLTSVDDLLDLHRSHQPLSLSSRVEERAYSFCMHRHEAKSQSMTLIQLNKKQVMMRYWNGQPCETDHFSEYELGVAAIF